MRLGGGIVDDQLIFDGRRTTGTLTTPPGRGHSLPAEIRHRKERGAMLGKSHFVSGIVAFEVTSGVMHYTPTQAVIGAAVMSSAALLPDIDHEGATISRTYGPFSTIVSRAVACISGGHRRGTHCLLGVGLIGALAQACLTFRHSTIGMVALSGLLILTLAAGVRIFRIPGWVDDLAPIPIVITGVCLTSVDLSVIPVALVVGCLTHILGDCLTNSGCPLLWPFSRARLAFGLFETGGWFENMIVFPGLLVAAIGLAAWKVWVGIA